jgi:hypothetical protein
MGTGSSRAPGRLPSILWFAPPHTILFDAEQNPKDAFIPRFCRRRSTLAGPYGNFSVLPIPFRRVNLVAVLNRGARSRKFRWLKYRRLRRENRQYR